MASGRIASLSLILLTAGLALSRTLACTAVDAQQSPDSGPCVGPACGPTDAGFEQSVVDVPQPEGGGDAGPTPPNPLCGELRCIPDDPSACTDSGAIADSGSGSAPSDDASAAPEAAAPTGFGCGVMRGAQGAPETDCVPSGVGSVGAPCVSSADCAAGLACVGDGNTAQCRPYCCGDPASCAGKTYCAERPLKTELAGETPLGVPVCVPADECSLNEPYPCPAGKQCTCKEGTACMVVKDGITSCVPPGPGRAGDACPCAAGYVCSKSAETCLKLCSTGASTAECGTGKCQSVAYLPSGFGVCGLGSG